MKILLWSDYYPPFRGGVETVVSDLASALVGRRHSVRVITNQGQNLAAREERTGVGIVRYPFRAAIETGNPADMLGLLRAVRMEKDDFQPDLVHVHFNGPSSIYHLRTMGRSATPTVVTFHAELRDTRADGKTFLGDLLGQAAWVTAVSQAMLDDVLALVPEVSARASVVYNGIDSGVADSKEGQASGPSLLCLGRHVREKGFDLAIEAFEIVRARYPHAKLVVASDGPERGALEQQARAAGLMEWVAFPGWLTECEKAAALRRAHILIVPSRWKEGFGLVALEAALHERPVVAARIGGLSELVEDGETGILVAPGDSRTLAAAIMHLLDNPQVAIDLGRKARARATAKFSMETCVTRYEDVYRRICDGSHDAGR